jgi:hypothetical protein
MRAFRERDNNKRFQAIKCPFKAPDTNDIHFISIPNIQVPSHSTFTAMNEIDGESWLTGLWFRCTFFSYLLCFHSDRMSQMGIWDSFFVKM